MSDVTNPGPRVLLLSMPWGNPTIPNLAICQLKAVLERAGVGCDTRHANLAAVRHLGGEEVYDVLLATSVSDLVFTPHYYDVDPDETAVELDAALRDTVAADLVRDVDACRRLVAGAGAFLDELFDSIDWASYDVVGFTTTFQQTVASLSLARRIKRRHPSIQILFGGAGCDGDMGAELVTSFAEVDYVIGGEADEVIVDALTEIRARAGSEVGSAARTPGLIGKPAPGQRAEPATAPIVTDLDALPYPDYDDYFEELSRLPPSTVRPRLSLEQSRGCWYGEKQACSFCGLSSFQYRAKSSARAVDELVTLAKRYRLGDFYLSDNILSFDYYESTLRRLAELRHEEGFDLTLFYEIKSNLKRSHVRALSAAGVVMVQIGIESFDPHVLKLMQKGVTAEQQIQSLRLLAEYGIHAVWNIIYANPGERPEDYDRLARILESMHHLPPPRLGQVGPMVLQRFNRYWRDPDAHGVRDIRPQPIYEKIFPDPDVDLSRLVCFFDYEHDDHQDAELAAAHARLFRAVERWQAAYSPNALSYTQGPDFVRIEDRRPDVDDELRATPRHRVITLRGLQAEVFLHCDEVRPFSKVCEHFADRASEAQLARFVDGLVAQRVLHRSEDDKLLALPLHRRTRVAVS